jgi:hypothetical protein
MKKPHDFSQKPFFKCLSCPHLGTLCRGRTSDLDRENWFEFMTALFERSGMTEVEVAAEAKTSVFTVHRIFNLKHDQDVMRDVALSVGDVFLGSARNYPCLFDMDKADSEDKAQAFKETIECINASHTTELEAVRSEYQATIDMLREQVQYLRAENDLKAQIIAGYLEKAKSNASQ